MVMVDGAGTLFDVPAGGVVADVCVAVSSGAVGAAAEHSAVAELLRRGHKVAVPVVDDDGVDLVVDYCVKVQVKSTRQRSASGTPELQFKRNSYARRRDGARVDRSRAVRAHIDVLLVLVADVGWYVVPRAAANDSGIVFGPAMEQWRDAWSVFDASRV